MVLNTILLLLYIALGVNAVYDFQIRLRALREDVPALNVFIEDFPSLIYFLFIIAVIVALAGVILVYQQLGGARRTYSTGWWIQGIGLSIYGVVYLIWISHFLDTAGSFG